jgi:hypothetical protein
MNRSKDMVRPFVGSVADVFARTRRTTSKTLEMLQLALLFPYAKPCMWGRPSRITTITQSRMGWPKEPRLNQSGVCRQPLFLDNRAVPSVGAATYLYIRLLFVSIYGLFECAFKTYFVDVLEIALIGAVNPSNRR